MNDELAEIKKGIPIILLSILGLLSLNFETFRGYGIFVFGTIVFFGVPATIYYLIKLLVSNSKS